MIPLLENGQLSTPLDARGFGLVNIGFISPPPPNLVVEDDPRLDDARAPLDGSVTDLSVADDAAIIQSKLNLNGLIPPAWLGASPGKAAPGQLAEYVVHKAQPNGYASLDSGGKVPVGQLPAGAGAGTITSLGLTMPSDFGVAGSPVTTLGTLAVTWNNVTAVSWFGNSSSSSAAPAFSASALPVALVPSLPTSKIVSGVFVPARLPVAVGVGGSHAPGAAPDPGASGVATDYLARDMTYKTLPSIGPTYQPTVPNPVLSFVTQIAPSVRVFVAEALPDAALFYKINAGAYQELGHGGFFTATTTDIVKVFGAKVGYNNSGEVTATVPP